MAARAGCIVGTPIGPPSWGCDIAPNCCGGVGDSAGAGFGASGAPPEEQKGRDARK